MRFFLIRAQAILVLLLATSPFSASLAQKNPSAEEQLRSRISTALWAKDWAAAISHLGQLPTKTAVILDTIAVCHYNIGQYDRALDFAKMALQRQPTPTVAAHANQIIKYAQVKLGPKSNPGPVLRNLFEDSGIVTLDLEKASAIEEQRRTPCERDLTFFSVGRPHHAPCASSAQSSPRPVVEVLGPDEGITRLFTGGKVMPPDTLDLLPDVAFNSSEPAAPAVPASRAERARPTALSTKR